MINRMDRWTIWLVMVVVIGIAPAAHAHRVNIFAWVEGDQIYTESKFSGGKPVQNGQIRVLGPDGALLLVANTSSVARWRADGSHRLTLVTFPWVNTASEYAYVPQPIWSPAGDYGLVAISSPEPFGDAPSGTLWRLPREGEAVPLVTIPGNFLFNTMEDALWSPDRSRICYFGTAPYELMVAQADGSDARRYAVQVGDFLGWAPDSEHLAFKTLGNPVVMLGSLETTPQPLKIPPGAADGSIWQFGWMTGTSFVALSGDYRSAVLWRGSLDGATQVVDEGVQGFDVYIP